MNNKAIISMGHLYIKTRWLSNGKNPTEKEKLYSKENVTRALSKFLLTLLKVMSYLSYLKCIEKSYNRRRRRSREEGGRKRREKKKEEEGWGKGGEGRRRKTFLLRG